MKKLFYIFAIGMALISCSDNNDEQNDVSAQFSLNDMEVTYLKQGALHGSGIEEIEEGNYLIDNQSDWEELLAKMDSYNDVSSQFSTTEVDFSKSIVVAVFDEVLTYGGWGPELALTSEDNTLIITKVRPNYGDDAVFLTVISRPFTIATIPITDVKIEFRDYEVDVLR